MRDLGGIALELDEKEGVLLTISKLFQEPKLVGIKKWCLKRPDHYQTIKLIYLLIETTFLLLETSW